MVANGKEKDKKIKLRFNVLPSSALGEGSASHRTASSSEVPQHT